MEISGWIKKARYAVGLVKYKCFTITIRFCCDFLYISKVFQVNYNKRLSTVKRLFIKEQLSTMDILSLMDDFFRPFLGINVRVKFNHYHMEFPLTTIAVVSLACLIVS